VTGFAAGAATGAAGAAALGAAASAGAGLFAGGLLGFSLSMSLSSEAGLLASADAALAKKRVPMKTVDPIDLQTDLLILRNMVTPDVGNRGLAAPN
jgi:hypothetical protein